VNANPNSESPEATWVGAPASPPQRLLLSWGAHEKEVTKVRPLLRVGRGELNDLVIRNEKVSRLHAVIKYCELGFVLTDHSSNGTYVVDADGTTRVPRNEAHLLAGTGMICFGSDPATTRPPYVRYATSQ
jgi:adenylate cyclase